MDQTNSIWQKHQRDQLWSTYRKFEAIKNNFAYQNVVISGKPNSTFRLWLMLEFYYFTENLYHTNQTSFFRLISVFFTGETYLVREFWLFIFIRHDASRNKSDEYDKKSLFAVRRLGSVSHARSQELKITLGIILGSLIDFIFWINQTYDFNIHIIWYDNYSE